MTHIEIATLEDNLALISLYLPIKPMFVLDK